ncbi:hypothetical protein BB560_000423 [Smittium megazygosporum]|uniref:UmuC domain-containing protein n=1 Tax=Smittium megazygosporum TaxID=133381 RepID=A0A2T9ZKD6_9FUNG|nr:hypothetical protein BB560_000423 [Smittium megazygosporum]
MDSKIITYSDFAKIIIHLDLDCFYCQVEQRRLGISDTAPLCVQQWGRLIAVNYVAKKYGIKRNESASDALKKCPDLILVHVATFAPGKKADYYPKPNQATHKTCLDSYRRASKEVFSVIRSFTSEYQKGGLDEAYIDITELVSKELEADKIAGKLEFTLDENNQEVPIVDWEKGGVATRLVVSNKSENIGSGWYNLKMFYGALVTKKIREAIFSRLGFTTSGGISHSKILSKLGSSLYKPNKQAIILKNGADDFILDMKIEKIRFLGGKLGAEVKDLLSVETIRDLQSHSFEKLKGLFPLKSALYLYKSCRGIDSEISLSTSKPNTMSSVKSFGGTLKVTNLKQLQDWLYVLCIEIWERLMEQQETEHFWPRKLLLSIVSTSNFIDKKQISMDFPKFSVQGIMDSPEPIARCVFKNVIQKLLIPKRSLGSKSNFLQSGSVVAGSFGIFPIVNISLHAAQFYGYDDSLKYNPLTNWINGPEPEKTTSQSPSKKVKPSMERVQSTEDHILTSFAQKNKTNELLDGLAKNDVKPKNTKRALKSRDNSTQNGSKLGKSLRAFYKPHDSNTLDSLDTTIKLESNTLAKVNSSMDKIASLKSFSSDDTQTPVTGNLDSKERFFLMDPLKHSISDISKVTKAVLYVKCQRCSENTELISIDTWTSHVDYHVALQWQTRDERASKVFSEFNSTFKSHQVKQTQQHQ